MIRKVVWGVLPSFIDSKKKISSKKQIIALINATFYTLNAILMVILSQRDARWSEVKLGASSLSCGRFGCTSTAISMLSDYFKNFVNPADIAKHKEFYTKDGLILWTKLSFKGFGFEKRLYGRNDAEILKSLKDPKKACILEVQGKHWVVCTGKDLFGRYKIADPWFGDLSNMSRYKDQITGSAHFEQK